MTPIQPTPDPTHPAQDAIDPAPSGSSRAPRRGYAASRSDTHRPTLSLHDFRTRHKARSLQLGWVGLSRPRDP